MTTQTMNKVMQQRLTRGTTVIVTDSLSFSQVKLRGKHLLVTSKGPVKCNKGGRCAGPWCVGLAIFVSTEKAAKQDKKMGWRKNAAKICLTHIKDQDGVLIVPPPILKKKKKKKASVLARPSRINSLIETNGNGTGVSIGEVTWADLAAAHQEGDIDQLALLARALKVQTGSLKTTVIESQARLIESLTRK